MLKNKAVSENVPKPHGIPRRSRRKVEPVFSERVLQRRRDAVSRGDRDRVFDQIRRRGDQKRFERPHARNDRKLHRAEQVARGKPQRAEQQRRRAVLRLQPGAAERLEIAGQTVPDMIKELCKIGMYKG